MNMSPGTMASAQKKRQESNPQPIAKAAETAPVEAQTWIITDGAVGMEAQGRSVAEAVGLPFVFRRIKAGGAAAWLPVPFRLLFNPHRLLATTHSDQPLEAPWPRLVISVGRKAVPAALAIKRASKGATYALHVQSPKVPIGLFDLIAAPMHDRLEGPNVIQTFGAVHSVTRDRLAAGAAAFAERFAHLPRPLIGVVLGGKSQAFDFSPAEAAALGAKLAKMAQAESGSLLVTPSRRTPAESFTAFLSAIADVPTYVWNGNGENPYFAILGSADAIVVTADSVNMVTEASGTGKPVLVESLSGKSKRLSTFHAKMREAGATRPFEGRLERYRYEPINDTEKVAKVIRAALGLDRT